MVIGVENWPKMAKIMNLRQIQASDTLFDRKIGQDSENHPQIEIFMTENGHMQRKLAKNGRNYEFKTNIGK